MATPRKRTPAKKAATEARKAEAGDGFVTIEQCGVTLRIPVGEDMPLAVFEELGKPDPQNELDKRLQDIAVTRALLGPEQWQAFTAAQPLARDYNQLSDKINGILGNS